MSKVREVKNSPSLAEDFVFCSPSLAEGVRGWVFFALDSAKFLRFAESNPPPLSPSAREGEFLLSLRDFLANFWQSKNILCFNV
ncbi:hypothetical protein ACWIUD_11220 [Helicobacter sp. 23-1044]